MNLLFMIKKTFKQSKVLTARSRDVYTCCILVQLFKVKTLEVS